MLKFFKKGRFIIVLSLFCVMIFTNSYAGLFGKGGSSALGKILKILVTMEKRQLLISDTQLKQYLTEAKQLETEIKMWQNQLINLKNIDQEFKTQDIDRILSAINRIENFDDITLNDLRKRSTILDNISKYFSLQQNEFAKEGPRTREEIKKVEERLEKMRDDVKQATAKINQKSRNGYTKKNEDLKKLKEKTKKIFDAKGELEVLQAIGASLGQTNEVLIDIKEILRDQNNLIANLQQSEATEKDEKEENAKKEKEANEKLSDKWEKDMKRDMGKKNIIKF